MKKYALLVLLFGVTLLLGVMVYKAAHEHMALTSISEESMSSEKVFEKQVKEEAFAETTRELAREGGKSVAHFLFSLIYK